MDLRALHWKGAAGELHALVRDGDQPPVIFLHGAGGNALSWGPLLDEIPGLGAVLVDLPGHGESGESDDWSIAAIAAQVADTIGSAFPQPMIWVGHSWGGKIGLQVAADHPATVRALALVDPSPIPATSLGVEHFIDDFFAAELGPWTSMQDAIATAQPLNQYENWSPALERAFCRGLIVESDGICRARVTRSTLVSVCTELFRSDCSAVAASLRCPTLLIAADQTLPMQESINRPALPQANWCVLPGTHWIHTENPVAVARVLREWLAELGR